jgi:hypothetical protein
MTREPLILSDTAMVLLQRSVEENMHVQIVENTFGSPIESPGQAAPWYEGLRPSAYFHDIKDCHRRMMHEIWLLWTFQDVPIIRHLEWNLRFNDTLMAMAKKSFVPLEDYAQRRTWFITSGPLETIHFIEALHLAYHKALTMRAVGLSSREADS